MQLIRVKRLHPDAIIPKQATQYSACFDLYTIEEFTLKRNHIHITKTGLSVEIPHGYYLQILPRSGLSTKGLTIINSPGIIDSDYRGEIMIIHFLYEIENDVSSPIHFDKGDRIAQCILQKCNQYSFAEVAELSKTKRGIGGLGSTGK